MRHEIETASGDFFTLDDRKDVYIKVAERLSVLFKRQIFIRWGAGNMKVFFGKSGSNSEYSVAVEASGLVNIISILAALFDETIEVLLIDEPEVSLHPQLQSYLFREMTLAAKEYNKTIIISTHSAQMIELHQAADLCNYVFFSDNELPKQIAPDAPELNNNKLKEFLLRMSLIYNEGFFAKKVTPSLINWENFSDLNEKTFENFSVSLPTNQLGNFLRFWQSNLRNSINFSKGPFTYSE